MPKSRKPRKKYHRRFVRPLIPLEVVEKVKDEMRDIDFEQYDEQWARMQAGFHSFYGRVLERGIFTATAEELNAIRDGLVIADAIVNAALDADPIRVARTWAAVQQIVGEAEAEGDDDLGLIEILR